MNERLKNMIWLIVVVVAFAIFSSVRGGTSTYLDFSDEKITVIAPENFSYVIGYEDIRNVELVDEIDPGTMLSGGETRKYQWGTWENQAYGEYTLCVSKRIDNALVFSLANGETLVVNYESDDTTQALLDLINDLIKNSEVASNESRS